MLFVSVIPCFQVIIDGVTVLTTMGFEFSLPMIYVLLTHTTPPIGLTFDLATRAIKFLCSYQLRGSHQLPSVT
jgi:hypothetical protein